MAVVLPEILFILGFNRKKITIYTYVLSVSFICFSVFFFIHLLFAFTAPRFRKNIYETGSSFIAHFAVRFIALSGCVRDFTFLHAEPRLSFFILAQRVKANKLKKQRK